MDLDTDDDIYTVDNVYLGPPGYTFPFKARYFAYGLWLGLVVLGLVIERITIGLHPWPVVYLLAGAVFLTRLIGSRVTHEVPVRSVLAMFLHELRTPRRNSGRYVSEADLGAVRSSSRRDRSRLWMPKRRRPRLRRHRTHVSAETIFGTRLSAGEMEGER